jgi:hypothetical protein
LAASIFPFFRISFGKERVIFCFSMRSLPLLKNCNLIYLLHIFMCKSSSNFSPNQLTLCALKKGVIFLQEIYNCKE